jgi:transposase-like protein
MDPTQGCCPHEACPARGQGGKGNITVHSRQQARYRCTGCEQTFSARRGTMCSWKQTPVDSIVLVVTLLAHGCPVRAMVAAVGWKAETVRTGAAEAGVHGAQVHRHLVLGACWSLRHGHADEMRVRVQKGMVWMAMALMVSTRLWLSGVVSAQRDTGRIRQRADRVRACARLGALLVAVDGLAASVTAVRCAVRSKAPRKGPRRPHLAPWEQVVIGQVVTQDERGRMVGGVRRLVQGAEAALDERLASSGGGQTVNTASSERLHATVRSRLASLVRRTRSGARRQRMVPLGMDLVGTVSNCCTPHDTLTNAQGHRCTPAMAASLTHHVWTVAEWLHVHVPPPRWQPPKQRGRRSKELQTLIEQWAS